MWLLVLALEIGGLFAFIKGLLEVPGLGRLGVLAVYVGSFVAQWALTPSSRDSRGLGLVFVFAAARFVVMGGIYLKSVVRDD